MFFFVFFCAIEEITVGNKIYTLKIYKIAFSTGDDLPSPSCLALSNVCCIKALNNVEDINQTVTPSIEWTNGSGTIEFSDTDNTYPAGTPVPTGVPLSLNITPTQGTIVEKVIVDGENYGGDLFIENIILSAENQNHSIKIICENQTPTHSIDIINGENGTTEILDAQGNPIEDLAQVPNGAEIQVLARSDEGYRTTKIKINGVEHSNPQHLNPFIVDAVVNLDMTIEIFRELETSSLGILGSEIKIGKAPNGFTIMPGGEGISNLSVHSIEGKLVNAMSQISGNDAIYIPISQPGVYVVSFMIKGEREIRKVVIQ